MKKGLVFLSLLFFLTTATLVQAKYSTYHCKLYTPKSKTTKAYHFTYTDYTGTKRIVGETYKTTGVTKVKRSSSAKHKFLKSHGLTKTPVGYEIDHTIPLSKGGSDTPSNMELLPKAVHKAKTARERKYH